ncbi:MAG: hypothetical protein ACYSTZ_06920 [Planctomycetota bacterium]|jgi:hypothetical protein
MLGREVNTIRRFRRRSSFGRYTVFEQSSERQSVRVLTDLGDLLTVAFFTTWLLKNHGLCRRITVTALEVVAFNIWGGSFGRQLMAL